MLHNTILNQSMTYPAVNDSWDRLAHNLPRASYLPWLLRQCPCRKAGWSEIKCGRKNPKDGPALTNDNARCNNTGQ